MKMKKNTLVFLILVFLPLNIVAQEYKISLQVKNLKDTMMYLGSHYGSGTILQDSAKLDSNGKLVFQGNKKLDGGLYFILFPNGKFFDLIIDTDQNFDISCDTSNFIMTVKFEGSVQNKMFYTYQQFLAQEYRVIAMFKEKQKSYLANLDSLMIMEDKIQQRQNRMYLVKEDLIAKHPDSLLSALIKAGLPIVPPPPPRDEKGNLLDSAFTYRYIKNHYFDNIDFSDNRLIRTYSLENKINTYLGSMVVYTEDSIKKEVDMIMNKASANKDVYKFVLGNLFRFYNQSQVISDENIFVYIAEKYYLNGKADWVSKENLAKLKRNIDNRKLSLIGNIAPDFSMKNRKGKLINLRNIKSKHTILYFYDINCEVCTELTPKLVNFYRIIRDRDVKVVAIYVGTDKRKWHKYIENNNMQFLNLWDAKNNSKFRKKYRLMNRVPQFFLLDKEQKIVLKRININQLMQYFNVVKD